MPAQFFADVSPATRKVMQANKGKDTKPELVVRRLLHGMGYRYRLHRKDLPGSPDLVFGPRRKVIFVHGCFWHAHEDPSCKLCGRPHTRQAFWDDKFARNRARDANALDQLLAAGWDVLIIWECSLKNAEFVRHRLTSFLGQSVFAEIKHAL